MLRNQYFVKNYHIKLSGICRQAKEFFDTFSI